MKITIHFTNGSSQTYTGCSNYSTTAERVTFSYTNSEGNVVDVVANWANINYLTKE